MIEIGQIEPRLLVCGSSHYVTKLNFATAGGFGATLLAEFLGLDNE